MSSIWGQLRANVDKAIAERVSPEEAARRMRIAKESGMPVSVVDSAPDEAAALSETKRLYGISGNLPTLQQMLLDPDRFRVAADDTGALAVISELANSAGRGFFKGLNNLAAAATDRKTLYPHHAIGQGFGRFGRHVQLGADSAY